MFECCTRHRGTCCAACGVALPAEAAMRPSEQREPVVERAGLGEETDEQTRIAPGSLAGIDSGVTMRLTGEGPTDSRTGQAGNILLDIQARTSARCPATGCVAINGDA